MKKMKKLALGASTYIMSVFALASSVYAQTVVKVNPFDIGFKIPDLSLVLGLLVRLFFIIAGLAALFMFLTGALAWVTSGGSKENIEKARDKIVAGFVGIILIVAILSIIVFLETVVFNSNLCFGIGCAIKFPTPLLQNP